MVEIPPKPIAVPYHIKVDPAKKGKISIYRVPGGRSFKLTELIIYFPVATYGELLLRVLHGEMPVVPEERDASGDNVALVYPCEHTFNSGSDIWLRYENTSTTDVHEAFVVLRGELGQF